MSLFSLSACDRQNYRNYLQSNMKFTSLLLMVPLVAAHGFLGRWPGNIDNSTVPEECCCLTYKASCTMNTERMFHVKLFYNRKKGTTPEEFNEYWANKHAALATNFHLRLGVVKYAQYHSTPDFRDLVRVDGGLPILEYDGAAEFWMPNLEILQAMQTDPEYVEKIQPDEANFIDGESIKMILGVDYIVVENQNAVEQHGRSF